MIRRCDNCGRMGDHISIYSRQDKNVISVCFLCTVCYVKLIGTCSVCRKPSFRSDLYNGLCKTCLESNAVEHNVNTSSGVKDEPINSFNETIHDLYKEKIPINKRFKDDKKETSNAKSNEAPIPKKGHYILTLDEYLHNKKSYNVNGYTCILYKGYFIPVCTLSKYYKKGKYYELPTPKEIFERSVLSKRMDEFKKQPGVKYKKACTEPKITADELLGSIQSSTLRDCSFRNDSNLRKYVMSEIDRFMYDQEYNDNYE